MSPISLPPGHPEWEGHTEGSTWTCNVSSGGEVFNAIVWVPPGEEPELAPAAPPNPATMAETVTETLPLSTAQVNTAPSPPDQTYVNLETWLWVPERQWQTLRDSLTLAGTTVTVTAKPVRAEWNLGEASLACTDAGRVWYTGMDGDEQTSCGYTYESTSTSQPDGRYPVSATIVYQVDWTCTGVCLQQGGTLGEVDGPTGQTSLQVGERQSVVVESG